MFTTADSERVDATPLWIAVSVRLLGRVRDCSLDRQADACDRTVVTEMGSRMQR